MEVGDSVLREGGYERGREGYVRGRGVVRERGGSMEEEELEREEDVEVEQAVEEEDMEVEAVGVKEKLKVKQDV